MTREEMVALIKGFTEAVEARDIGSEDAAEYITEIFDRYEAEQKDAWILYEFDGTSWSGGGEIRGISLDATFAERWKQAKPINSWNTHGAYKHPIVRELPAPPKEKAQ